MQDNKATDKLFDRYLRLLGIRRREVSYDALAELVTAHLMRLPFENVSKLYHLRKYGRRRLPSPEEYLYGIEHFNFGGTCYSNNYHLHLLMRHLGYDVMLCGADMANPDVHLVNMVRLDGREYLVDVGYAAPFSEPLPRDLDEPYEIRLGRDRYVLNPADGKGYSRMDLYRDGELLHGYTAKPIPRAIEHFDGAIQDSFSQSSTFMNSLLLVKSSPKRSIAVYNLSVIESEGEDFRIERLADRSELPEVVEKHFSIARGIVEGALAELGELGSAFN